MGEGWGGERHFGEIFSDRKGIPSGSYRIHGIIKVFGEAHRWRQGRTHYLAGNCCLCIGAGAPFNDNVALGFAGTVRPTLEVTEPTDLTSSAHSDMEISCSCKEVGLTGEGCKR